NLGAGGAPAGLEKDLARAMNDYHHEKWLAADPRWIASINVPHDYPADAVKEVLRCHELSNRYVQILFDCFTERPLGNEKYWPIYEVANELGLPIGIHVGVCKHHQQASGTPISYYF